MRTLRPRWVMSNPTPSRRIWTRSRGPSSRPGTEPSCPEETMKPSGGKSKERDDGGMEDVVEDGARSRVRHEHQPRDGRRQPETRGQELQLLLQGKPAGGPVRARGVPG